MIDNKHIAAPFVSVSEWTQSVIIEKQNLNPNESNEDQRPGKYIEEEATVVGDQRSNVIYKY